MTSGVNYRVGVLAGRRSAWPRSIAASTADGLGLSSESLFANRSSPYPHLDLQNPSEGNSFSAQALRLKHAPKTYAMLSMGPKTP